MKLRIVRDATLYSLRENVRENLDVYRSGKFDFLELDHTQFHELATDSDDGALATLVMPTPSQFYEVENCLAVHTYLAKLKPYDARDERLWVFLAHTVFLEYSRQRWPIPADDEKAVSHIQTHFFAGTNRQVERDNAVSRLWWMAHLCDRVHGVGKKQALEAFLLRSDVRASIIERPTIAQSTNVFSVLLKKLIQSAAGQQVLFQRDKFRRLMVELNSIGGFKLLDSLPENELTNILNKIVLTLGITTV